MQSSENKPAGMRRGIYLLPNLFTTGALFAGYYAIVAAMKGQFTTAAVAVVVAGVLDSLDGRVARLTNTQSDFGVQYDSLADLISFGLAPSLVVYLWALSGLSDYGAMMGKIGWLAAFLYAACTALRLARFNTQAGVADKKYFQGLASPAAAGCMISMVWLAESQGFSGEDLAIPALLISIVLALLMVSNIRYYSFKSWPISDKVPFLWIFLLLLLFVLLAIDPPKVLFAIGYGYLISGPIVTLLERNRRKVVRNQRKSGGDTGDDE
jgi:CDP-diacylglycerol--serine O-phosphatidyltransferase